MKSTDSNSSFNQMKIKKNPTNNLSKSWNLRPKSLILMLSSIMRKSSDKTKDSNWKLPD